MKHLVLYTIAIFLAWHNCLGQTDQKKNEKAHEKNLPESNITVNKEYDEDGNLIRYDSTYSWSYSGSERDTLFNDTLFFGNNGYFDRRNFFPDIPFLNKDFFNNRIFTDSLFADKFFSDEFFSDILPDDSLFFHNPPVKDLSRDQFITNREYMEKMFRNLDSLHNEFFRRHFSYPLQSGKENESNGKQMGL
jgi:hypothetical protein